MNPHSVRGDKRERILASALRVFASKGFFGTKVSDVAAAAGVADGTIYLYFKSKDDLLISLFEEQMERVNAELRARDVGRAERAPRGCAGSCARTSQLVETDRHAAEVITIELRQSAKFMKEYKNPQLRRVPASSSPASSTRGNATASLRADVPAPIAARALFGALDELALMWLIAARGQDRPPQGGRRDRSTSCYKRASKAERSRREDSGHREAGPRPGDAPEVQGHRASIPPA